MTLLTRHIEAGWREVESGQFGRWAAERLFARPGATASTVRVDAESSRKLQDAVTLRESQLAGADKHALEVVTNDGTAVTDAQHDALKVEGVAVLDATKVTEPVANEDVAAAEAGVDKSEAVDADPPEAPATEQTEEDSSSSSEPTSEAEDPSPEPTSTDSSQTV